MHMLTRTYLKIVLRAKINRAPVWQIPPPSPLHRGEGKGEGRNAFQLIDLDPLILTFSRREKGPTTFFQKLLRAPLSRDKVRFSFEMGFTHIRRMLRRAAPRAVPITTMKLFGQTGAAVLVSWCLAISAAHADVALDRLQGFFKQVQSLRGDFTQTTFDQHNQISQRARGTFAIQRPGKFHWDYTSPYHQLIVANNKKVWLYDSELEQVTVKKLDEAVGNTPAQLLSSGDSLTNGFTITELGNIDNLEWVELTPREQNSSFEQIRLGFDLHNLRVMELMDNFGHTTRLEFTHVQRNPRLAASLFEFTPPPGVDVVGE